MDMEASVRTGRKTHLLPYVQDQAWVLAADNELIDGYMGKERENLTPENFGEMYVRWRLDEGLYTPEEGDKVISVIEGSDERALTVNEFAKEVGMIMLPYLSTHPDVGLESFHRTLRNIAKIGKVSYYEGKLSSEYPYDQILKESYKSCDSFGKQPTVMVEYIKFGKGQKIQMLQYAHLKCNIYMSYGVKHLDVNVTFDNDADSPVDSIGTIQIWIA